ncbi:hypothetical protein QN277_011131 [Acacia crassicarpa]|uniref:Uncharacterized protein n=1 Tax=Acacia crassicarpa TaxID=499986 RepID=A0AAE1TBQ8_9FABA|nr:hypothetical protein QN277_011130 [Acacia crassicarpa]KAK4279334.1 hypothetical protein QN277_011131 [Acacia crassicarpa]
MKLEGSLFPWAKSLKMRPIKQHNPEPQASLASSRRKIGSHRKVSVLLSASLTIAVIGLLAIWSYSRLNFESGVSYEKMGRVVNEFSHDSDAFAQVIHGIGLQGIQHVPYILEPLPIDPEPPPRRIHQGARTLLEGLMILIRDGNLCFMTLRRFHCTVVPFPHFTLVFSD